MLEIKTVDFNEICILLWITSMWAAVALLL